MNLLKPQLKNKNFCFSEGMLYSKTGIEICYLGPNYDLDEDYTFYESGCMYEFFIENKKCIRFFDNDGHLFLSIKEDRPQFVENTVVLPLKCGLLLRKYDQNEQEEFTFKGYHGKTFVSNDYRKLKVKIDEYEDACSKIFE